ncbi:serine/threonine-protein kinase [Dokdonella immobilis]|uniref:Non-specific serine/threonine protein kinase/serine/threonine protein kinase n=1 Tax=Dokdonella immobilis TaxID=578942 RepID=A0A1I4Y635_9GAMM|nr:tetratricopeptide repeat protein [Dokdonella immobilis]SFN33183.1 non-specific serine/threonine protein kinase/serine/threonine protein kinase [Dokdonella immobilis]
MTDSGAETRRLSEPGEDVPSGLAIGPYRILRLLGQGGMGRVYLAQQSHPQRQVALKVVRGVSAAVIERMRREIDVLAQLEHPGIARLYAAGEARVDDVEVPWLAMEYVRGVDLASHVRERDLDITARLRLLIEIARAVHYAHERGVIHRDIKPGNILVDTDGHPKVLDFGIARLRHGGRADLTQDGQVLGTLPYMSAEQLLGDGSGVDARSDVYSLGVVAYELISGRLPHPRLGTSTVFEALDILRNETPPPLATINAAARGDLDTVIMKALASERGQRYASAADFAEDLQRFIEHRPIAARPLTRWYRAHRFVRRHRVLTAAMASIVLVLTVASAISIRYALAEQRARAEADRRARESAAVNAFLERMLASADPDQTAGQRLTVDAVVDQAERDFERLDAEPGVQRAVATTLSRTRRALGEFDAALALNARALALGETIGATGAEQAGLLHQRSSLLADLGRFDEAVAALDRTRAAWPDASLAQRLALDLTSARIDEEAGRPEAAERKYRALLESLAGVDAATLAANASLGSTRETARSNLAGVLRDKGALDESEALTREVLASRLEQLGERAPLTLASRNKLALVLAARGDMDAARTEAAEALRLQREVLGNQHVSTLMSMQTLANILMGQKAYDEAEALTKESLAGMEAQFGEDYAQTLASMNTLAYLFEERGRVDEAERQYRRIIAIQTSGGVEHPTTLAPRNNLAMLLMNAGRLEAARSEFAALLAHARRTVGEDHAMTAIFMSNEGLCLARMGRLGEARRELEDAHARLLKTFGPEHVRTRAAAERLAEVYRRLGQDSRAEALLGSGTDS